MTQIIFALAIFFSIQLIISILEYYISKLKKEYKGELMRTVFVLNIFVAILWAIFYILPH